MVKSSMIDHAGAITSAIGAPVIGSRASSMRLGCIPRTIEVLRWGTACRLPYLSSAWMCPWSPLVGFTPAIAWANLFRYLQAKAMDCRRPADAYKLTGADRWEAVMRCFVIVRTR